MATLTKIDRRPYQEMDYYLESMNRLDTLNIKQSNGEFWLAGWSKINSTPSKPANLVGYKPRGKYQFVQDSSFIRSIVISNGKAQVAFLNYELMIVHPFLYQKIKERIKQERLPIDHVYFTATHTHSGIGGYMPGILGKIAFGGYDKQVVSMLEEKSIQVLRQSLQRKDTVNIQFNKISTDSLVANRLIANDPIDPYVRQLIFQKKNEEKASILTYSAHSTIISSKFMGLSGDYPHYLSEIMESEEYELALFAAGTVGSHKPIAGGKEPEHAKEYAKNLYQFFQNTENSLPDIKEHNLEFADFPLALRKAHLKLGKNVRVRPWVFNNLFGETNAHFDLILLGNTLIISSSGEISGVFMESWEKYANQQGLNLIITCFNGGYIGYITPDEYYDEPLYEAREMNWFGPYNGAYFDEIIRRLIEKTKK
ncbi:neutral/alkaline non-lysosomal ceramidase N-terminal domain-containing protein [Shivajiella indica]|uniref:Neutral/alkaline non-lysosomal ceramidase N-terminal domain-containing protein n=1 Tax=Shivajiella indica TaxID=872115 RepID=A0ABW5B591_9BACT